MQEHCVCKGERRDTKCLFCITTGWGLGWVTIIRELDNMDSIVSRLANESCYGAALLCLFVFPTHAVCVYASWGLWMQPVCLVQARELCEGVRHRQAESLQSGVC